jgi:hypothetical protein
VPLVDESGRLTGLGQVIGGRQVTGAIAAVPVASSVPARRDMPGPIVPHPMPRTPQPALSPDRHVYPAPAVLPAFGLAPYSAMVRVPLDSGMRDHDWEPGERRPVPQRAAGVITSQAMLSNTAYELAELRSRQRPADRAPRPDEQRPVARADQEEAALRLSDSWTRIPGLADARRELERLYHDTGDRRALEAARAIGSALGARSRADAIGGPPKCKWCEVEIPVTTNMGPPREYCSDAHAMKSYRMRKRAGEAAAAQPVSVTSDPAALIATDRP